MNRPNTYRRKSSHKEAPFRHARIGVMAWEFYGRRKFTRPSPTIGEVRRHEPAAGAVMNSEHADRSPCKEKRKNDDPLKPLPVR